MATTHTAHGGEDRSNPPWLWFVAAAPVAACITWLTELASLPWWLSAPLWTAVAGLAVAGFFRPSGRFAGLVALTATYLMVLAGWGAWILWVAGWSVEAVAALAIETTTATLIAWRVCRTEPTPSVQQAAEAPKDPLLVRWQGIFDRCLKVDQQTGFSPIQLGKPEKWADNVGYTIPLSWSSGAITLDTLVGMLPNLNAANRSPNGCPVRIEGGEHAAAAYLHVPTVNDTKSVPMPAEYSPLSIREPLVIGRYRDRRPVAVDVYQQSGVVVGRRGAGKTVTLNVMTAQLARRTDAVIWHVDLNGGGMSSPWMHAFASNQIANSVIDWAAPDPEEALRMARVAMAIARDRKAAYQRLLIEKNVDVLPVTPEIPAIIIILDEGGEVMGNGANREAQAAANELRAVQRIGRAMAVNVVLSVQRGISTYLPSDVMKATAWKIGMQCQDNGELAYALGEWTKGIHVRDLTHPGMGYARHDAAPPEIYRGHGLLPAEIVECAINTHHLRPQLDARAVRVGGEVYAHRFQRIRPWLQELAGVDPDEIEYDDEPERVEVAAPVAAPAPVSRPGREGAELPPSPAETIAQAQEVLRQLRERRETAAATPPAPAQQPPPPSVTAPTPLAQEVDMDEWGEQFLVQLDRLPVAERPDTGAASLDEEHASPHVLDFIVNVIAEGGDLGVKTGVVVDAVIAAGYLPSQRRATVNDWLTKKLVPAGRVIPHPAGTYATWVAVKHSS